MSYVMHCHIYIYYTFFEVIGSWLSIFVEVVRCIQVFLNDFKCIDCTSLAFLSSTATD